MMKKTQNWGVWSLAVKGTEMGMGGLAVGLAIGELPVEGVVSGELGSVNFNSIFQFYLRLCP